MSLEKKIARALAAAFILGRNNTFSSVDELWPSWVPEAQKVLEGITHVAGFDPSFNGDISSILLHQSGTRIVTPQFINGEPIKLDPEILQ